MKTLAIKWMGDRFVPATQEDREACAGLKVGAVLRGDFCQMRDRSYQYHKRYFALLTLGFDYWEPQGGLLSDGERKIVQQFVTYINRHFGKVTAILSDLAEEFLGVVAARRAKDNPAVEKVFKAFRKWAIVEAGWYDVEITPGGARRVARSISFAKMTDEEFRDLYKATFNVLWRVVLQQNFETEADAMEAAEQLGELA